MDLKNGTQKSKELTSLIPGRTATAYIQDINPQALNAFGAAAFRFGHSLIPSDIKVKFRRGSGGLVGMIMAWQTCGRGFESRRRMKNSIGGRRALWQ